MSTNLEDYIEATKGLDQFGSTLTSLIKELLGDASIQTHSITYRVKGVESAHKKLSLKTEKYTSISDLTDLLGVRVITYFPDDVDKVAKIIRGEFKIDEKNSEDKRKSLGTDRFGYQSLHFVASLSSARKQFIEYKRFGNKCFELQVRSILQHAWAEIEHDLGYKIEGVLPAKVRRNFSRLAGLLELADEEFERMREEISAYEAEVNSEIKRAPQTLMIDQSTVAAALESEEVLIKLDKAIAKTANVSLNSSLDTDYVASRAQDLIALGVTDVGELVTLAKKYEKQILSYVKYWLGRDGAKPQRVPFYRGISLFYLCYVLAAQKNDSQLEGWGLGISNRHTTLISSMRSNWAKVLEETKT